MDFLQEKRSDVKNEVILGEEWTDDQPAYFHSSYDETTEYPEASTVKEETAGTFCETEEIIQSEVDNIVIKYEDFTPTEDINEDQTCSTFTVPEEECSYDGEKSNQSYIGEIPSENTTKITEYYVYPDKKINLQCALCKRICFRHSHLKQHLVACQKRHKWSLSSTNSMVKMKIMENDGDEDDESKPGKPFRFKCKICKKGYFHSFHYNEHERICENRREVVKKQESNCVANELNFEMEEDNQDEMNLDSLSCDNSNTEITVVQDSLGRYKCSICNKSYLRLKNSYKHLFECQRRQELAKRALDVSVIEEKLSLLQCPFCNKVYERQFAFDQHVDECVEINDASTIKIKPSSSQTWKICENIPTDIKPPKIEKDIPKPIPENPIDDIRQSGPSLKCPNCDKRFVTIELLDAHLSTAHDNSQLIRPNESSEDEEIQVFKKALQRLKCPFCGKTYDRRGRKHYRMHKGLCGKKQRQMKGLIPDNSVLDELDRIMSKS